MYPTQGPHLTLTPYLLNESCLLRDEGESLIGEWEGECWWIGEKSEWIRKGVHDCSFSVDPSTRDRADGQPEANSQLTSNLHAA